MFGVLATGCETHHGGGTQFDRRTPSWMGLHWPTEAKGTYPWDRFDLEEYLGKTGPSERCCNPSLMVSPVVSRCCKACWKQDQAQVSILLLDQKIFEILCGALKLSAKKQQFRWMRSKKNQKLRLPERIDPEEYRSKWSTFSKTQQTQESNLWPLSMSRMILQRCNAMPTHPVMPKPQVPPLDSYALVIPVPENSLCCSWCLACHHHDDGDPNHRFIMSNVKE